MTNRKPTEYLGAARVASLSRAETAVLCYALSEQTGGPSPSPTNLQYFSVAAARRALRDEIETRLTSEGRAIVESLRRKLEVR